MSKRAIVTLLFCDLVGSTDLSRALGDDDNDVVRRSLFDALRASVVARGGTVVKTAGDGLMATFSTSAADAVACAIAMQHAAATIEHDGTTLGLQLRVGISFGEASTEGGDWFGMPVVEAARLEAAAQPGQVLVSEVVPKIVGSRGGVRFRPAGKRAFKGFDRPVPVVEVVWRDPATAQLRAPLKLPKKSSRAWVLSSTVALAMGAAALALFFVLNDPGAADDDQEAAAIPTPEAYKPVLEPRDCPDDVGAQGTDMRCYDLIVPEDRAAPSGRQVRLLAKHVRATTAEPGDATIVVGAGINPHSPLRAYGDVAELEVRGRELTCTEISIASSRALALPAFSPESNGLLLDATEACGRRLQQEGINLNAYGINDVATDVADLAVAMSWPRVNVEAHREWALVPSFLSARHPSFIASVILVDPYPEAGYITGSLEAPHGALEAYFALCENDPTCARSFPDIRQKASDLYARLEREQPIAETPNPAGGGALRVMIDGDKGAGTVLLALELGGAPLIAATLFEGDAERNAVVAGFVVQFSDLDPTSPGRWGASISQYCEDADNGISRSQLEAEAALYPLVSALARDWYLDACERWPTSERSAVRVAHAETGTRALILVGALNPISSRRSADRAATAFDDAIVVEFPTLGSVTVAMGSTPCMSELRVAFLRNASSAAAVNDCIRDVPALVFAGT